jgi:tRNA1(Val) A37 N6-methylase TrmN6
MAAELLAAIVSTPDKPQKVLDVAAGHNLFGIAIAKRNSQAEIYGLDWQSVLVVAVENAAAAGVGSRYHKIQAAHSK